MADFLKTVMGGTDLSGIQKQVEEAMAQGGDAMQSVVAGGGEKQPDLPIWQHPAFVDMFGRPFNLDARAGGSSFKPDTAANALNSGLSILESFGLDSVPLQQGVAVLQASGATSLVSKVAASAGDTRATALVKSSLGAATTAGKNLVGSYVPGGTLQPLAAVTRAIGGGADACAVGPPCVCAQRARSIFSLVAC